MSVAATMCYKRVLLDKVLKQSHEPIHDSYPERPSLGNNEKPYAARHKWLDAAASSAPFLYFTGSGFCTLNFYPHIGVFK